MSSLLYYPIPRLCYVNSLCVFEQCNLSETLFSKLLFEEMMYDTIHRLTRPEIPLIRFALRGSKSTLMYPSMAVSSFLVVQLVEFACSHQLPWYHPGMIHWYLLPYMFKL